ncbi:MAG TPA: alpha/beta hydrolase, partial [Ilumatobacteraceae bacterium]
MAASNSPLIILVHGAWHGAWCWAALQAELDSRGMPSLAIDLPGHGASGQPFSDLHGDAAAVARLIERLGTPVTLVGHSYGGAVISQAAAGLSAVAHLVYLAAYVPDIGESVTGMSVAMPKVEIPLSKAMAVDGDGLVIDAAKAGPIFYGHA